MDGAHDVSNSKKATVLKRAQDQIRNAMDCSWGSGKIKVYPLLGKGEAEKKYK